MCFIILCKGPPSASTLLCFLAWQATLPFIQMISRHAVIVSLRCQLCMRLTPFSLGLPGSRRTGSFPNTSSFSVDRMAAILALCREAQAGLKWRFLAHSLLPHSVWCSVPGRKHDMPLTTVSQHWAKLGSSDLWLCRVMLLVFYMSARIQGCWAFRGMWLVIRTTAPGAHVGYVWWLGKEGKACGEEVVTAVN